LGPAAHEKGRTGDGWHSGPMARSQSFRRLRCGRRPVATSSAMTGSATRVPKNLVRQQRPWAFSTQRVVVLRVGVVRDRHRDRLPCPESVAVTGPARSADADPAAVAAAGPGSPMHRLPVTFGARRASVPARRPAVACGVRRRRRFSATSGRLDGLPRDWYTLIRRELPEGAPLENVPTHAPRGGGTFSRTARPPVRPSSFFGSRVREPGNAEGDSVSLRPDGDRRMPGTRPSCPWRQTPPARPPVRDVSCSAEPVILGAPRCTNQPYVG
jgi:hypothetical protein